MADDSNYLKKADIYRLTTIILFILLGVSIYFYFKKGGGSGKYQDQIAKLKADKKRLEITNTSLRDQNEILHGLNEINLEKLEKAKDYLLMVKLELDKAKIKNAELDKLVKEYDSVYDFKLTIKKTK